MLGKAFSGFSVDDVDAARHFYGDLLGLTVEGDDLLWIRVPGDSGVLVYPKGDAHEPASFTVLNFPVDDVPGTVATLRERGVAFEKYAGTPVETDDDFVFRGGGPLIAWFTDPAGNVLSVIQDDDA
ncbi:catechol 2,3-dioxygenase-like lactoylglutathione lyase family enzyme [Cellulosimicrobium cellulans]|uniref:Glyoxalase n=1 Tax=Cellulosimicrobium cellulans TaxID=1710 RepID=A0A1Y0HWD2_CELCE|nr:VOC family protein [Cellulosimicrobium cellulans]ARU51574.1 glyoxalase [Cellulosimicrobium cellulans]MBM7818044.1 catechol 2,3-dioxygenase-like lactoylglutathione lyase family enzyme [Cellulosimicrobium cellulans]